MKSNFFLRLLLCLCLFVFGALFARFTSEISAYARSNDNNVKNQVEVKNNNAENIDKIGNDKNEASDNQNKVSDKQNKASDNQNKKLSEKNQDEVLYVGLENSIDTQKSESNEVDEGKKKKKVSIYDEYVEIAQETRLENIFKLFGARMDLYKEKYVLASSNSKQKNRQYPENWINEFNKKIIILQNLFPDGKYWNHMGKEKSNSKVTNNIYSVTDTPCKHWKNGESYCNAHYGKSDELYPYNATCTQCRGFASMLSDMVFGEDAPVRYFENYDELRIGDQARIDGDYHTVFIIDKTDEYVIVAECNMDLQTCKIQWGRKILRKNMAGWYISRWED